MIQPRTMYEKIISLRALIQYSCLDLVIEIPRVSLVVLVAAVFGGGFLPLCVISHVVLKDTGEGHSREHAHHWSQCQHQTDHHAGKIDCADGVQGHWNEEKEKEKRWWSVRGVGE